MISSKILKVSNGEGKSKRGRTKQNDRKVMSSSIHGRNALAFSQAIKPLTFFFFFLFLWSCNSDLSFTVKAPLKNSTTHTIKNLKKCHFFNKAIPFDTVDLLVASITQCFPNFPSTSLLSTGIS